MADRRKNKKKKEVEVNNVDEKPSKEEYAVARYLKQKLPEKKTMLLGHKVEYFIACKAVDLLMESPWAKEHKDNKKSELNFSNRIIAMDFMAKLLGHKFFHRAKKIVVTKEPKKKKTDPEETAQESGKESKKSKGKTESEKTDSKKEGGEVTEKKKEKRKIKLDMHLDQLFIDSNEPYVWIYDPIPLRTWITGALMVIAAVLLCLFPLWPQSIRHYIYYLSVAAAFFLIFIIGLAVLRLIVFVTVWVLTLGRHHLWLLPNLTEDVGFFDSFWPLYMYEYRGSTSKKKASSQKKSKKDDQEAEEKSEDKEDSKDESAADDKEEGNDQSESEQRRSEDEGQKTENGFEFLEAEEVSEEEEESRKDK
ncbi:translocation protein SEC62 [Caerostris darwini]|uniref:Translocation protein SEC62 n=1 Tax=Caerostris darwini TaxID=1538125 RepID=A0AAV4UX97_9ARAC|nr:translocation protein SEC62 [Caerostris darwini]